MSEDTIAAIATAPGEAGIGIVRISGDTSLEILNRVFKGKRVKKVDEKYNRRVIYGYIIDKHEDKEDIIDEVLVVYMKAPYTYTTEDVVEINCHGGSVAVRRVLEEVLKNGARIAERGEFTKRAFLNGRIDLAQAEAVMDLIGAKTDSSYDVSLNQLEGKLSIELRSIRDMIIKILAHIEAVIDFPEDDIEDITYKNLKQNLKDILERIDKLIETSSTGKILREGLKTIILGKPNVGKSSLMNAILRENRAIVTDVPGTTRDIIEEYVNINGIPLKVIDTAGIRDTEDVVEKIGVERAKNMLNEADLVIAVFDVSRELTEEDLKIIRLIKDKNSIVILNKTDLPEKFNKKDIEVHFNNRRIINMSILEDIGIEDLENTIKEMFFIGEVNIKENPIVNNIRHKELLIKASENIRDAINSVDINIPIDCIEVDVKDAWNNLGKINGDTVAEDVIDRIFKQFCIGK